MLVDDKPEPDDDVSEARAEDQSRGRRRGSWLDTDAINAQRLRMRRLRRLDQLIKKRDRRGVASVLRALGLDETDPRFVAIWRQAFGSSPSQGPGRKP